MATLTFEQGLKQYYALHPGGATKATYEGLFPYMQGLGFKVARPTRSKRNPDGSRMLSSDKIVNAETGALFDIISKVDEATGSGKWMMHSPKTWKYWVNGKASQTPIAGQPGAPGAAPATVLGAPSGAAGTMQMRARGSGIQPYGTTQPTATALGAPIDPSNPYAAAALAALRQRGRSRNAGGRAGTVLGGFTPGAPATARASLGGY